MNAQRLLLACRDAEEKNQAIDTVCAFLHQRKQPFGLLVLRGALLSNINVAENLWLCVNWHRQQSAGDVLPVLQQQLARLGYEHAHAARLLAARPAQLNTTDLRAVILLRALLMEPVVLLVDNDWFAGVLYADRDLMQRAEPLIAHFHWWVLSDDQGEPVPNVDWQRCDLSMLLNEFKDEY